MVLLSTTSGYLNHGKSVRNPCQNDHKLCYDGPIFYNFHLQEYRGTDDSLREQPNNSFNWLLDAGDKLYLIGI